MNKILFLLVVLLYLFHTLFGLQCYYCNSITDPDVCGKEVDVEKGEKFKLDCIKMKRHNSTNNSNTALCYILQLKTHDIKEFYVRDCGFFPNEQCDDIRDKVKDADPILNLTLTTCKTCEENLCNK